MFFGNLKKNKKLFELVSFCNHNPLVFDNDFNLFNLSKKMFLIIYEDFFHFLKVNWLIKTLFLEYCIFKLEKITK